MIEMIISSQPSAHDEAERLDASFWCDETPLGLYVDPGDRILVQVVGMSPSAQLSIVAGFCPTWSADPGRQEFPLQEGANEIDFDVPGPVFVRHIGKGLAVTLQVRGGKRLALWDRKQGWVRQDDGFAPWVQYVSDRALITLPRSDDPAHVIAEPTATFDQIERLIGWLDELSGRTDPEGKHAPCQNRVHFLTDIWASEEAKQLFYMYAYQDYIAMLPENICELVNPEVLSSGWGIWHELGHLYQPHSWTWSAHVEVNVNIWSLFAQERFGQKSRLETEPEHRATAARLLAEGQMDVTKEGDPFVHLVMLDRLREEFGWGLFVQLNRKYREAPLSARANDSAKVALFCQNVEAICGKDMSPFFKAWGLV
jgi:hypothetical protein